MGAKRVIRMGHPTLRLKAKSLSKEEILSDETRDLVQDLIDTMEVEDGIGIAAPQINISKQVAIICVPDNSPRYPGSTPSGLNVIINPKITILDDELQGFWEGCLSVPGLRGFVKRPRKVQIDYLDLEAKEQTIIAENFLATVYQHELDHLFGHLYIDKVSDPSKLSYNEEFVQFWANDAQNIENQQEE